MLSMQFQKTSWQGREDVWCEHDAMPFVEVFEIGSQVTSGHRSVVGEQTDLPTGELPSSHKAHPDFTPLQL